MENFNIFRWKCRWRWRMRQQPKTPTLPPAVRRGMCEGFGPCPFARGQLKMQSRNWGVQGLQGALSCPRRRTNVLAGCSVVHPIGRTQSCCALYGLQLFFRARYPAFVFSGCPFFCVLFIFSLSGTLTLNWLLMQNKPK